MVLVSSISIVLNRRYRLMIIAIANETSAAAIVMINNVKKNAFQLMWIEIFIESYKINVDAIQDEFYRHEGQ